MNRTTKIISTIVLAGGLSACANMTPAEKGTALGAATGAVIGNVVGGGSTLGTVGGAAVGGVIGHEVGKRR